MTLLRDRPLLANGFSRWLDDNAFRLDVSSENAAELLPALGDAGVFRIGVPTKFGGAGHHLADAISAVAAVSSYSLAAGFVFWSHRTFIEYLLRSPHSSLRDKLLPDLLTGSRAGATGLSNAMKFLSGIEQLQIEASGAAPETRLNGKLPWVTNLRPGGFDVAAAVQGQDSGSAFIVSLSSEDAGVVRSNDLDLMALRGSNTAAIQIENVRISKDRIIHHDAHVWLPLVRPAFLGLQCGMSIGLARRSLAEAASLILAGRSVLGAPIDRLTAELEDIETRILSQTSGTAFVEQPSQLFRLRIRLSEIVNQAVQFELGATGGKAYLSEPGQGYQRRLRESAFIPIVTPSVVQLKTALEVHDQRTAASEPA